MARSSARQCVVEIGGSAAVGLCGRVLRDLGLPVVRLIPPDQPSADQSRTAAFLDPGKTIRPFSLQALPVDLADAAVILVDSWALDAVHLTVASLRALAPEAVVAVLELPALPTHLRTDESLGAALDALCGLLLLRTADDGEAPLLHRSLALPYAAGLLLTVAALAALVGCDGQAGGQWVEVRALDAAMLLVEGLWVAYPHLGVSPSGRWTRISQLRLIACADGYVAPIFRGQDGWERLCLGLIDRPDLVADPRFATLDARANHMAELRDELAGWFAARQRDAVFDAALELQLPFGKFLRLAEQLDDPQNRHRGFFVETQWETRTSRALRLPFTWECGVHGAPLSAEPEGSASVTKDKEAPLAGLRVVEMGMYWAGPLAGRVLAELGADVVKLESPQNFDPSRYSNIADNDAGLSPWERGWATMTSCGKRSAVLNLNDPMGRDALRAVLRQTDVLLANTSARVLPNLGLAPSHLCAEFPQLTVLQMTGYGADGPYATFPAFGIALEAISGLSFLVDGVSETPVTVASTLSDPIAGLFAAIAVIARRAGLGAAIGGPIDLSERECVLWMAGDLLAAGVPAPADATVTRRLLRCADGWLVTLTDAAHPLADELAQGSERRSRAAVAQQVAAAGGAAFPVRTAEEVAHAPDLLGRGILPVQQPEIGWRLAPSSGIRFERSRTLPGRSSPRFGSDTRAILRESGLPELVIDQLFETGVAALRPNPVPAAQMIDLASMERLGAVGRRDPNYRSYLRMLGTLGYRGC